jgi:hypothetical protein
MFGIFKSDAEKKFLKYTPEYLATIRRILDDLNDESWISYHIQTGRILTEATRALADEKGWEYIKTMEVTLHPNYVFTPEEEKKVENVVNKWKKNNKHWKNL